MAEMGIPVHYMTLDLPCNNKQHAVHPLPIQIPNREIITSNHTALLSPQDLPIQARKPHLFLGLNKDLPSMGKLCDNGCEENFNDDK